jgi:ribosomal RNA assembly protein
MEQFIFNKTGEIRKHKEELERKLKVSISITGKKVVIEGDAMDEYESSLVLDAIDLGFSAKKALQLKDPEMTFRKINIKKFSKPQRRGDVRSRIIGTEGKTKRTIENIGSCDMVVKGNEIGIICPAETIEETTTAIINLVRGSKQSNVYAFMEKMNRERRGFSDDLGLKTKRKEGKKEDGESEEEEIEEEQ